MAKSLMAKKVFIFLILLLLTLSVSACLKPKPAASTDSRDADLNNSQSKAISPEELEKQYQASLVEILKPFWSNNEIFGLKDKIIALRAPAKYLDLHFNLVIAFELIEQGQASADQAKIEDGLEKIFELKTAYSWLAED